MKLKLTKDPSHKGYYQDQDGNLYVFRFGGRPIKVDGYRDDKPKEKVNRDEVTVDKEKVIDHSKTANAKDDEEYYKEIEIEKKKAEDNDEAILRYSQEFSMKSPVNDLEAAQNYLSDDDMTKYVPDELLNVVQKAEWVLDDESSGHINIETSRELNAEEQKILSDWIEGQNSDGLGEGFEQQEFAENYFDPNSGDGPYTRYEAEEEISRRIEDMDTDEYWSYIDESEIEAGVDNYIEYNDLEYTEDEEIREGYKNEMMDDPFSYIDDNAIYEARDKAAMDDTYYNIDEWYNMSSMETHDKDFIIEEVQNLNQDVDLESMVRNSNTEYTEYGDVRFYSREDFKNFGQTIADKLNEKYAKDYDADFRYSLYKNNMGTESLHFYDANEAVESTHHIYEDLAKEVKSYFGEEGTDVFVEPYDSVSTGLAGFYGEDYVDEDDSLSSMSKKDYTSQELKDKYGTDDVDLINAGKPSEERVYKIEENKKTTTEEIAEEVDKNYPELSKRVEEEYYASMKQAAKELGYYYDSNKASEFLAIIERAEEIRNKNRSLQNRYSGTISTLQELHPGWSMAKIMEKIRKLDEED